MEPQYKAPGRLGDPEMTLSSDPRVNRSLLQAAVKNTLHEPSYLTSPLTPNSSVEELSAFVLQNEDAIESLYNRLEYNIPHTNSAVAVIKRVQTATIDNGIPVRLIIYRPVDSDNTPLPAVMYFHGGGMVILKTENKLHLAWAQQLARMGLVVVMVDYRNGLNRNGMQPFPAGLDDCVTAVRYVSGRRQDLHISKLILQGESGGANLAFATTIRAKREGWSTMIDGVCGSVPYISGAYGMPLEWRLANLPSLVECDGYLVSCSTSALTAKMYDPSGNHARNPLAWPYWASEEDLQGLPPHLVVTSELDPLKDEGKQYAQKLSRAGVKVVSRENLGIIHQGEMFLAQSVPELYLATLWELKKFADSC